MGDLTINYIYIHTINGLRPTRMTFFGGWFLPYFCVSTSTQLAHCAEEEDQVSAAEDMSDAPPSEFEASPTESATKSGGDW